jgi:hypothetical protein
VVETAPLKNPAAPAVQRETEEDWGKRRLAGRTLGGLPPLRTAAPSIRMDQQADRLQGDVAELLGIALTGFRKCDDAVRKRRTNGVVPVGCRAKRGQRHLKGNTHLTDSFAVELMTVEVGPDWHEAAVN